MPREPVVSEDLLSMVRCPADHSRLTLAEPALLAQLNEAIAAGALCDVGGSPIERPLEAGLVRADGRIVYPVVDGLPRLLVERGIRLDQLDDLRPEDVEHAGPAD